MEEPESELERTRKELIGMESYAAQLEDLVRRMLADEHARHCCLWRRRVDKWRAEFEAAVGE